MGETYYHLDRRNELAAGRTIEFEAVDAPERSPLRELYSEGVSSHGSHYFAQDLYDADGAALWDVTAELVFELVRVARFPERPSRFQSVFGFRARRDLDRFAESYVDPPYTVWRVTADRTFTSDMKLVDVEDVPHGTRQAEYYWRGRTDVDKPLWETLLVPPVDVVERVDEVTG
ncbi:hypothetical protein BRC81_05310 [Halobacteriales archaeon QS_1_68_20]|nr:MAG: hypothetical protein BRC81_05310 [Halobacteriales archaeon QS_1_68_20]